MRQRDHIGPVGPQFVGHRSHRLGRSLGRALVGLAAITLLGQAVACSRAEDPAVARQAESAAPSRSGRVTTTASPPTPTTPTTKPPTTETSLLPVEGGRTRLTLAFAGDLLPHLAVNSKAAQYGRATSRAYDYAPMLAPMAPILGGVDVAICHLEVPVAPAGQPFTSYPAFGSPGELVDAAQSAGFDGCSTASNHSLDRGRAGIAATLDRLDILGLQHAGSARTEAEANRIATYEVDGVKIAHLSYAYWFNGYSVPPDAPWSVNEISADKISADAARARVEGADLVIVSLHWGTEYDSVPSPYQRFVAASILPSENIDLVIGHHAHVVQPIEQVAGTFVVWGLGNQLSNMKQDTRRDGLTVVVGAERAGERWRIAGIEAVPTWVDLASFRVLPVVATMADPATPEGLRRDLFGSYVRTVRIVTGPGTPGVSIAPKP